MPSGVQDAWLWHAMPLKLLPPASFTTNSNMVTITPFVLRLCFLRLQVTEYPQCLSSIVSFLERGRSIFPWVFLTAVCQSMIKYLVITSLYSLGMYKMGRDPKSRKTQSPGKRAWFRCHSAWSDKGAGILDFVGHSRDGHQQPFLLPYPGIFWHTSQSLNCPSTLSPSQSAVQPHASCFCSSPVFWLKLHHKGYRWWLLDHSPTACPLPCTSTHSIHTHCMAHSGILCHFSEAPPSATILYIQFIPLFSLYTFHYQWYTLAMDGIASFSKKSHLQTSK